MNALLTVPAMLTQHPPREGEADFLVEYANSKYGGMTDAHTADAVVLAFNDKDELLLLCIKRKNHPYKGYWCLPGGFVDQGEHAHQAVMRELAEETNLHVTEEGIVHVGTYSEPWRDPRMENVISDAFMTVTDVQEAEAGDDAAEAVFMPVSQLLFSGCLGFDHERVLYDALAMLSLSENR